MKFSTRQDTDLPAEQLFDAVADFPRLERMLLRRGVSVEPIAPETGAVMAWQLGFDWRGQKRRLRMDVTRFDRPEVIEMRGQSEPFDIAVTMSVVALSREKSRLIFELEAKPRNMRSRLLVQTARLGKPQLDRKFEKRIGEFVRDAIA